MDKVCLEMFDAEEPGRPTRFKTPYPGGGVYAARKGAPSAVLVFGPRTLWSGGTTAEYSGGGRECTNCDVIWFELLLGEGEAEPLEMNDDRSPTECGELLPEVWLPPKISVLPYFPAFFPLGDPLRRLFKDEENPEEADGESLLLWSFFFFFQPNMVMDSRIHYITTYNISDGTKEVQILGVECAALGSICRADWCLYLLY